MLGCSDSRVPAELVFDQGFGDLFVIRVAGNIVAPSQVGSVEFAAREVRHAPGRRARPFAVRRHPRHARGARWLVRRPSRATCARSSIACGPRLRRLLSVDAPVRLRGAHARRGSRQRPCVGRHLRHGSELLERLIGRTVCSWSARSTRSKAGIVTFFDGVDE